MPYTTRLPQVFWIATALTAFMLTIGLASAAPRPDEERYFDRDDIQNVAMWLALLHPTDNQLVRGAAIGSGPCGTNGGSGSGGGGSGTSNNLAGYASGGGAPLLGPMNKRNSELINSLLSLPKSMNNAGK